MSRWIYAVFLGLAVGIALGVALHSIPVGLAVGVGLFFLFASASTRRSTISEVSPSDSAERSAE